MATITQLPAQLNLNAVAGNPSTLVFNLTITDSNNHTVPWSDVTGYQVDIVDQYGSTVVGVTPTITNPAPYVLNVSWTATQTSTLGETLTPRMALSIYILSGGPYALVAGTLLMSPPEWPATPTPT
jgi:hypothetical protein